MLAVPVLAFLDVGAGEFIALLVVALILYGGKLPRVARDVGRTVGQLKRTAERMARDFSSDLYDDDPPPKPKRRPPPNTVAQLPKRLADEPKEPPPDDGEPRASDEDDEESSMPSEEAKRLDVRMDPLPPPSTPATDPSSDESSQAAGAREDDRPA